ncbi:hypothetical protein PB1_04035 [Bacillus methanolicus PB1]|uniref:ABM domain-containing protein n=1 Tax=Bacillus methanolicus PB1 TaxID=997296 RepID=I3E6F6_BACMT|nr:hypothetical protein PB1_04035 [Bacillus methanolicus PB1]
MSGFAKTPEPPYFAVIFVSQRTKGDRGYARMAEKMLELASKQKGFLDVESARVEGLGITVSYWDSLDAIKNWKENSAHKVAQDKGKIERYKNFALRVCKVERDKFFEKLYNVQLLLIGTNYKKGIVFFSLNKRSRIIEWLFLEFCCFNTNKRRRDNHSAPIFPNPSPNFME